MWYGKIVTKKCSEAEGRYAADTPDMKTWVRRCEDVCTCPMVARKKGNKGKYNGMQRINTT